MDTDNGHRLRGYRSVNDISFDLDGVFSTYIGWVLFEVGDTQLERVRGVIGTFNNYATLMLLRLARDQRPCRVHGRFNDGQTDASEWTLDNVTYTGAEVHDESGFVAFHASAFIHTT